MKKTQMHCENTINCFINNLYCETINLKTYDVIETIKC